MDATIKENLEFLQETYNEISRELDRNFAQIIELVWPLLTNKRACEEVLDIAGDNAHLRYLIMCKYDKLTE